MINNSQKVSKDSRPVAFSIWVTDNAGQPSILAASPNMLACC